MASARRAACAALAALCLAPAPAPDAVDPGIATALRALAAKDLRVATIAYRLQTAGVAYCQKRGALSGLVVQDASQYRADLRPAVAVLFHLGDEPAVVSVVSDSAGEKAGVHPGDVVAAVNGASLVAGLPIDVGPRANGDRFTAIVDRLDAAFDAGSVTLSLVRDGEPLTIRMAGERACASNVQLDLSGGRNAGADGKTVNILQGLYDFARSDDELAVVIGHELSHNILGHRDYLKETRISEGLFGGFGRNGARIRRTEREADYLGLYLVAAAGYDIQAGAAFWRRMGRADPLIAVFSDRTHPGNGARVRDLEREAAEIEAQRTGGRPLVPDYDRFAARADAQRGAAARARRSLIAIPIPVAGTDATAIAIAADASAV